MYASRHISSQSLSPFALRLDANARTRLLKPVWKPIECRLDRCNEFLHGLDRKGLDAIADVHVIAGYSDQLVKLVFDTPNVEPNVVCPILPQQIGASHFLNRMAPLSLNVDGPSVRGPLCPGNWTPTWPGSGTRNRWRNFLGGTKGVNPVVGRRRIVVKEGGPMRSCWPPSNTR